MNQNVTINDRMANIITLFELTVTQKKYIIYWYPEECIDENVEIYIGNVDNKMITNINKDEMIIIKNLVKELLNKNHNMMTLYKYNIIEELESGYNLNDSQKIKIDTEKLSNLQEIIPFLKENRERLLKEAEDEYYIELVKQKEKERKIVIALILLIIVLFTAFGIMLSHYL